MTANEIFKALEAGSAVSLDDTEADNLRRHLAEQNGLCELGRAYLAEKRAAIIKSGIFGDISAETVKAVVERMSASELSEFYRAAEKKNSPVRPQISGNIENETQNGGFMIR